ncbi:MAG: hypothetical protein VB111_11880 [Clostridiaceae bacterium]|nr:hypothetical protein [Clostridiaceae bacterium]
MDRRRPTVNADCPFGTLPFLGTALAVLCWLNAAWTVSDRFLSRILSAGDEEIILRYLESAAIFSCVFFPGGALFLYLLSIRVTDTMADKGGFLLCAASALCAILSTALSFVLPNVLLLTAVLMPLSTIFLLVAFLIFASNRENSRDTRLFGTIAVPFLVLRVFAYLFAYYTAWTLQQGGSSALLLSISSYAVLFVNIISYTFVGTTFLFMRTPVPAPNYPLKLKY